MADLIDRAQAIKLLMGEAVGKYPQSFYFGLFAAAKELKELPAVDAAEVKHGHWQEYEDYCLDVYYDCSVCGDSFYMADGTPTENGYNYCPKCGARLDGTIRVELENDEID